jgi:GDP-L-fucose synthase
MPTNLYGPGDNFHLDNAHVLPALMRRFHDATRDGADEVTVWGSGNPRREFLHVDDLAAAALFVMDLPPERWRASVQPMQSHLNVGCGSDVSIREVAKLLAEITGFAGRIVFDRDKPDGAPRKLLDVSRLADLGWKAQIGLREGVAETYRWFLANAVSVRR